MRTDVPAKNARWAATQRRLAATSLALLAAGALAGPANASLTSVSPLIDPNTGLPTAYGDVTGLNLTLCADGSANCALATPDAIAARTPGSENFYARAVSTMTAPTAAAPDGIKMIQTVALQAGITADGKVAVFQRIRTRIVGATPSATYTAIEPYGTQRVDTNTSGTGTTTQDIGCPVTSGNPPCNFASALATGFTSPDGSVGPFLTWDAGAPAGYIGDAATPHAIAGSPTGNNFFRMTGPGLPGSTSTANGTAQSNLYVVTGKLDPNAAPGPHAIVSPASLAFGNQSFMAASAPKRVTVTSSGSTPLTMTSVALAGANASEFTITASTCTAGKVLATAATCTIDVAFKPALTVFSTAKSATLTISDNAPNSPQTVSLTGTATLLG